MLRFDGDRSPAFKFLMTILVAGALAIPIFMTWFLVYDRQSQAEQASASITEGWGGPQAVSGPTLVIPYRTTAAETVIENGQSVTRTRQVIRELSLSPEVANIETAVAPERRKRSIYEAVVYDARLSGSARFALPPDLERHGLALEDLDLERAELRFGISDPRGIGSSPRVVANGQALRLQPGGGSGGGRGFFAWIDASQLRGQPLPVDFQYALRGSAALSLSPMRAKQPGRSARPGRTRRSAATSCPIGGRSAATGSARLIVSAISRSAVRWCRPETSAKAARSSASGRCPRRRARSPLPGRAKRGCRRSPASA